MKHIYVYFLSLFLIFSCTPDDPIIAVDLSDAELIELIKNYDDKVEVLAEEMPTAAENYIVDNFINSTPEQRYLAHDLGYEVKMRRNGRSINSLLSSMYVYFNLEGNLLLNDYYDQDEDGDYDCDEDWEEELCFDIIFPIEFTMPDGSVYVANNEDDLFDIIDSWYDQNPDIEEEPVLHFPIEIIWYSESENGGEEVEVIVINSMDELEEYYEMCEYWEWDDEDWEEEACFDIVFPIEFTMPDGSVYVANNEDDLFDIIDSWYEDHPDVDEDPEIHFPIEIIWYSESENGGEEEEIIEINSMDELDEYYEMCED